MAITRLDDNLATYRNSPENRATGPNRRQANKGEITSQYIAANVSQRMIIALALIPENASSEVCDKKSTRAHLALNLMECSHPQWTILI